MIAFPSVKGFHFWALASSIALRTPIFRQILCSIGACDASRSVAAKVSLFLSVESRKEYAILYRDLIINHSPHRQ
jgi:hypothetical protein